MPSIGLLNNQRVDATRVTLAGSTPVAAYREHVRAIDGVAAGEQLGAYLRASGLDNGSIDLNIDGTTSKLFWLTAAADKFTTIRRVSIVLGDTAILEDGFGGLAELAVGLALEVTDSAGVALFDLTGGAGVKSHADLLAFGADLRFVGSTKVAAAWTLASPLELAAGQRFRATVRDDLTGLTRARIFVAGETRSNA